MPGEGSSLRVQRPPSLGAATRREESELSGVSSPKDTNPMGSRLHPYGLL